MNELEFAFSPKVMYGGRAIDDFDRRVLRTYMNEYMGDFIFDTFQPFYFHRTDDVGYYIPTANQEQAPTTGLPDKEVALGKENTKAETIFTGSSRMLHYSRSVKT